MPDKLEFVVGGVEALALPEQTRSTLSHSDGRPDVARLFPEGPAVYAVSVLPTEGPTVDAVGLAAGDLVYTYRRKEGFSRTSRPEPLIDGATDAMLLDFEWDDQGGVRMHSLALVAGRPNDVVVVHGAMPALHGDDALAAMESTMLSCRLLDDAGE